jgi:hypothetical protein
MNGIKYEMDHLTKKLANLTEIFLSNDQIQIRIR